jgi:hypothetical protein
MSRNSVTSAVYFFRLDDKATETDLSRQQIYAPETSLVQQTGGGPGKERNKVTDSNNNIKDINSGADSSITEIRMDVGPMIAINNESYEMKKGAQTSPSSKSPIVNEKETPQADRIMDIEVILMI